MDGAHNVAARMAFASLVQVAPPLQHDRLAVAAKDVGNQLYLALGVAHQGAALAFLWQGVIIARLRRDKAWPT